jgi:hypothetical protein
MSLLQLLLLILKCPPRDICFVLYFPYNLLILQNAAKVQFDTVGSFSLTVSLTFDTHSERTSLESGASS